MNFTFLDLNQPVPILPSLYKGFKEKDSYSPSKLVKLHYEKYSPIYNDDFQELEIFLDDIIPLLENDQHIDILDDNPKQFIPKSPPEPEFLHHSVTSDFSVPIFHDDAHDINHVTPVAIVVDSDKPPMHDSLQDAYVSPFHTTVHPTVFPIINTSPLVLEKEQDKELYSNEVKQNKYFSGLIPHAINIQINIPPSDDRQYKETDTYREHKHIAVTEKPGYVSPLGGAHYDSTPKPVEVPLPPALPSYNPTHPPPLPGYNPTVSPKVPPYHSTTLKPLNLLPHHPPPNHYEAPHKSYIPPQPQYEQPVPATYDVTPKPHHLIREFKPPHADYLPPSSTLKPVYEAVSTIKPHYEPPKKEYLPPKLPAYHESTPSPPLPSYKEPSQSYVPPSSNYLPPHEEPPKLPAYHESTPSPLLPGYKEPTQSYVPPSSNYLPPHEHPPKLPAYHESTPSPLLPGYKEPPSQSYAPPSSKYLPPHDDHHSMTKFHPPSKEYLPPLHKDHHYKPGYESQNKEYLPPPHKDYHHSKTGYEPPSKEYLPPTPDHHPTDHGYSPPSKEYLPPPSHHHHADKHGYSPPTKDYLPPPTHHHVADGFDHIKPPSKDYLPPSGYIPPGPEVIHDIDGSPLSLLNPPHKDYLPPPPRLEAGIDKKYVAPPPRGKNALTVPEILNSHIEAPRGDVDHYIPPKTLNDVPKNFIRPDDILPPPPELLDVEGIDLDDLDDFDEDSIEITLEDLESLGLPGLENLGLNDLTSVEHPFLGLAKFRDGRPKSDEKKKGSKRQREKQLLNIKEEDKFEKLRNAPGKNGEVPFPPMPTTAPDSLDSVPIIERLRPEVLAQLRRAQASGGSGGSNPGFIPGKAGVDYPDFRSIPTTDFTCENFILPGFYADTFTSCQVSGKLCLMLDDK